ncbi:sugar/nucleoside kinase (ribokinase family) [Burkholderia sp. OAS925]
MTVNTPANPDILALGEAMIEFNQSAKGEPKYLQGFGGDTSNFCIAAARQGARTGFVSAVGADHFGRLLIDLWERENVDTAQVRVDPQASTGVYFVSHGPDGHGRSTICERARRRAAMRRMTCRSTRLPRPRSSICRASVSRSACPHATRRSKRSRMLAPTACA